MGLVSLGVALLFAACLAVVTGIIPLTCGNFTVDVYGRYNGSIPATYFDNIVCLPNEEQMFARNIFVQGLIVLLGFAVSAACTDIAVDYFFKLSTRGSGITVALAELLLNLPAPATQRGYLGRLHAAWGYESRRKLGSRLSVVLAVLTVPLIVSTLSPLATVTYNTGNIRLHEFSVNVTNLPDWISYENITKLGWLSKMDDNQNDNGAFKPDANAFFGLWASQGDKTTPTGYVGSSLFQYLSGDVNVESGVGSGLQTVFISVPKQDPPRTLGIIPLSNVLLTPWKIGNMTISPGARVPVNASDFTVEQSALVLDQTCAAFHRASIPYDIAPNDTFWSDELVRAASSEAYPVFSTTEDAPVFTRAINSTRNLVIWPYTSEEGGYDTTLSTRIHYEVLWNLGNGSNTFDESVVMYTAMPRAFAGSSETPDLVGLMCKTTVFPIAFNTTIPGGFSSVRAVDNSYKRIPFTAASKQLVSLSLNLTDRAVAKMQNASNSVEPLLHRTVTPCYTNDILHVVWPQTVMGGKSLQRVYNYSKDCCFVTEYDRLFKAYMTFLSFVPSDTPSRQWSWGAQQIRWYPNKLYCGAMLGLMILLCGTLVVLRVISYVPGADHGNVDVTSPWAAQLAKFVGRSELTKQEGSLVHLDMQHRDMYVLGHSSSV